MEEEKALLELATQVVLNQGNLNKPSFPFWSKVRAGAFVTAYTSKREKTSENVWCCMSNGDYESKQNVVQNVAGSALVCTTRDPRRSSLSNVKAIEIDILAPRSLWIERSVNALSRRRQRAISVTIKRTGESAIYLPQVWNERPQWTADLLIGNLIEKASTNENIEGKVEIYEIPTLVLFDNERIDHGFFASLILQRAFAFYQRFLLKERLAYVVFGANDPSYENEGAWARSYADVVAFYRLSRLLNQKQREADLVARYALEHFPSSFNDISSRTRFLLAVFPREALLQRPTLTKQLLAAYKNEKEDYAFAQPQIVLSLFNLWNGNIIQKSIEDVALDFFVVKRLFLKEAIDEHSAFAANWILQAWAATPLAIKQKVGKQPWFDQAISACQTELRQGNSITIQACAAHGLLAVGRFPYNNSFFLLEKWAHVQAFLSNNHFGFPYYVRQQWYRTDVTTHVVEVCFLLYFAQ